MKQTLYYLYYSVMVLVLALYVNMGNSPSVIIRFLYLVAAVIPLFKQVELMPAVIVCLLTISTNTFASPLMPTEWYYYVVIVAVFAILNYSRSRKASISIIFIVLFIYVFLNDLLFTSGMTGLSEYFPIFILMFFCIPRHKLGVCLDNLSLAFVISSLVLSYWVLFRPEARIQVSHVAGDLEAASWGDPNYLACVIGMGSIIAMNELLNSRKGSLFRLFCFASVIISTIANATLGSRSSILAVSLGIVGLVLTSPIKKQLKLLVIIVAVGAVYFMNASHVFDLLHARFIESGDISNNRFDIWTAKLSAFYTDGSLFNWLFGFGKDGAVLLGMPDHPMNCHNEFLSVLVRFGMVGFLLFCIVYTFPIRYVSKPLRPTTFALFIYLMMLDLTLDPLCFGYFAYLAYFFYLTQYARYSKFDY